MSLEDLQAEVNRVWNETERAGSYDRTFMAIANNDVPTFYLPQLRPNHAAMHLMKAVGKVAAALEPADHGQIVLYEPLDKALADVVICACRIAGLTGRPLEEVVALRVAEIAERTKPEDHA